MARPLRIEYPDAIYHVTARGIEGRDIVADDVDRYRWLRRLETVVSRCRWRAFAFALMDNHFHLFLQTPEANLSAGMHDLVGGHAAYFNTRHSRSGHLFQGRFKAVLIASEGHWLEVSRYVHLNPVRAGLVAHPDQWHWSSFVGYVNRRRRFDWLDYARVLADFGGDTTAARRRYRAFVERGIDAEMESPLALAWHGTVLGSQQFLDEIRARLGSGAKDEAASLLRQLGTPRPDMETIIGVVSRHFKCDPTEWQAGRRSDDLARAVAAHLARELTGLPARTIAASLGYGGASSVSMACRRVVAASEDRRLARTLDRLTKQVLTTE